jgi:CheY-like chemotaxis protein
MANGEPIYILFVEDDPAHAEIAMRNLRKSRIANNITHVSDGQQALDYLYRQGEYADPELSPRPHIVLLDLRLPKVDGLEVLAKIRSHPELHHIPIVVLTTSEAEIDIVKAYSYNVNSYLVKPLDFNKFSDLLDSFGFYWMAWNKFPN